MIFVIYCFFLCSNTHAFSAVLDSRLHHAGMTAFFMGDAGMIAGYPDGFASGAAVSAGGQGASEGLHYNFRNEPFNRFKGFPASSSAT